MPETKNDLLERLRKKAQLFIDDNNRLYHEDQPEEIKRLFYELQIYQIEIEMQNDELRAALEELEIERNKFSGLFDNAPVGYIVTSAEGVILDINQTALSLLDKSKGFILQKPLSAYIESADISPFYAFLRKLKQSHERQNCLIRLKAPGGYFYAHIEGVSQNGSGSMQKYYLTITDVTAKYKVEQELKQTYTRLDLALNASNTGIWEIDISTGKIYLDDFCYDFFGFTQDTFNGNFENILELVHPDDRDKMSAELERAISNEVNFNVEYRLLRTQKNMSYVLAKGHVIYDKEGRRRFVATFTDITERKILERETLLLKDRHQKEITTATLQAEENLKKRISESLHDGVSQMLYAIKINIDQIKSGEEEKTRRQISQLIGHTIREVRNISFELAPAILVDFGLAATIKEMAQRLSGTNLSINTVLADIEKQLPLPVQTNIFRIIQELVNNSINHGAASKIKITLQRHEQNAEHFVIKVTDNGKGFDIKDRLPVSRGSGLSSIRNRLSLYNGSLDINSVIDIGTTVVIHFFYNNRENPFKIMHEQQH
jgi:PAS domain S-box-containing protein